MKKLMIALMALVMVSGSMLFALTPESKTVVVATTIEPVATMNIVDGNSQDFNSLELPASGYSDAFYVKTSSNVASGFKLSYTMTALQETGNTQVIPVTVYTLADSTGTTTETSFNSKTAPQDGIEVLSITNSTGTESHSVAVQVKAVNSTWKTDVKAGTYAADLTFTFTAN